jgi:hypothetical protein
MNLHRQWQSKNELAELATIKIVRQTVLAQQYQSLKYTAFQVAICQYSKQAPTYLNATTQSRLENKVLRRMAESTQQNIWILWF